MALAIEAFLLPSGSGRTGHLLALWQAPAGALRGVVLHIHPFAEEMNKTRRMAALQACALAEAGYGVLRIDLKGCGDSSGEFGDATWADWLADVQAGVDWLRRRSDAPLTLWGLRAGCLLLADAAARWTTPAHFLFWQPTPSGTGVLRQFLRTAAAAAFLDGGGKGVVDGLRQRLAAGQAVTVGGYRIHPALAAGLEQSRLAVPAAVGRVWWFEVSAVAPADRAEPGAAAGGGSSDAPAPALPPASAAAAGAWRQVARSFEARVLSGPPFWQTAEIEVAPALVEATTRALDALTEARP